MGKPVSTSISGTAGNDILHGTAASNRMYGYAGDDELYGNGSDDELQGHEGNDRLYGGDGNDSLYGGIGDDILEGGNGDDRMFPGIGNDQLTGGAGADQFAYTPLYWTDQTDGITLITDFQSGVDKIDLTRLDANETTAPGVIKGKNTPGNEAFIVVQSTDGVTPGHLVISTGVDGLGRPITIVTGYTNSDPGADLEIHLLGVSESGAAIVGPQDFWL